MPEILPPYYREVQLALVAIMFVCLAISLLRPAFALYAYIIIVLFRPGQVFPELGAYRFELLAAIFIAIVMLIRGRLPLALTGTSRVAAALYCFMAVVYISVPQAFDRGYSWEYAYSNFFLILCFFIMTICLLDDSTDIKRYLGVYLLVTVWLTYLPLFDFVNGIGLERGRTGVLNIKGTTSGVAGHVGMANVMVQSLPFSFYLAVSARRSLSKVLALGAFLLCAMTAFASGSRGGFVGIVLTAGLLVFKSRSRKKAAVVVGLLVLLLVPLLTSSYMGWVSTILDLGNSDVSAHSRLDGLRHGIEMAIRRPILGVGIGCFAVARGAWFGWSIWAHNLYGELIGELGILGILSWGALIWFCFIEIRLIKHDLEGVPDEDARFLRALVDACWTVLVVRLAIGMLTHSLAAFIWYMVAGLLVVTRRIVNRKLEDAGGTEDLQAECESESAVNSKENAQINEGVRGGIEARGNCWMMG